MQDTPEITLSDLSAYHDGELSAEDSAKVEKALARDPELRATLEQYAEISQTMGNLPPLQAPPEIVGSLRTRIREDRRTVETPRIERRPTQLVQMGSWAALFLVAAIGFFLSKSSEPESESMLAKSDATIGSGSGDEASAGRSPTKLGRSEDGELSLKQPSSSGARNRTLDENARSFVAGSSGVPTPQAGISSETRLGVDVEHVDVEHYGRRDLANPLPRLELRDFSLPKLDSESTEQTYAFGARSQTTKSYNSPQQLLEQFIEIAVIDFAMNENNAENPAEFSPIMEGTDQRQGLPAETKQRESGVPTPPIVTIDLSVPTLPKEWDATLGELEKVVTTNQPAEEVDRTLNEIDQDWLSLITRYRRSDDDAVNSADVDDRPKTITLEFLTDPQRLPLLVKSLELWRSTFASTTVKKTELTWDGSVDSEEGSPHLRFQIAAGLTITATDDLLTHLDAEDAISMSRARSSGSQSRGTRGDTTERPAKSPRAKPKIGTSVVSEKNAPKAIQVVIRLAPEFLESSPVAPKE